MILETNDFGDEANRRLVECKLDASQWTRTQLKSEASICATRRCDAAGLNANEFFVLKSRNSLCVTIHTVCIVSACVARCTLVERA